MKIQLFPPLAIYELGNRKNQEDTIYPRMGEATPLQRVFIVCDGMGGHDKGEVASEAVCRGLSEALEQMLNPTGQPEEAQQTSNLKPQISNLNFSNALEKAFDALDAADVESQGKMGTTMTAVCLHRGGCLAAHIGDSRIYHLRPQSGEVLYRSRDHSLVQQLYELGEISYNEMATSPRKNIILRAMQPHQEERSKATVVRITDLRPDDYLYLCSDGMLEQMDDDELISILRADTTDQQKVAELVRRTAGNADNHSAWLIHIKDVEREPGDEQLESDEEAERSRNKALNDNKKDVAWNAPADKEAPAMGAVSSPAPDAASGSAQKQSDKQGETQQGGKGRGRRLFAVAAALVVVALLAAAALFLFSGRGGADSMNGKKNGDDEPTIERSAPFKAKPYLEKKASDKMTPVEPDPLPESKPHAERGE